MKPFYHLTLATLTASLLSMCSSFNEGTLPISSTHYDENAAERIMQDGINLMSAGKFSSARSRFEKITDQYPLTDNAAKARYYIAQCFEKEDEPRDAFKQYDKLITSYPNSSLYAQAIARQRALAHGAASGEITGKILWGAWTPPMDSSVVIEWLQTVIRNAPFSDSAAESALALGNFQLERGDTERALDTFSKLVNEYPTSNYAAAAQMKVGMLWMQSSSRGDRNLVNLNKAQEAFEEFSLLFPKHKDEPKAAKLAAETRQLMVGEQLKVARYYLERSKEYRPAVFMLEDIIRQEKTNPQAAEEARKLLPQAKALANQAS